MAHLEREKRAKTELKSAQRTVPGSLIQEEAEEKQRFFDKDKTGDKTKAVRSDTELFYEKILNESLDKNTALRIKSYDIAEEGDWTVLNVKKTPRFTQKLPEARDTYKARKAENNAVKEAKKTFRNADLCTVREKAAIEEYFARWKNGDPGITGTDEPNDPSLMEYVQSILSMEFSNAIFTDDYLSDHMPEMFEYARKLRHFSYVKEKYPAFYAHLGDDKKALLETRAAAASDFGKLLSKHMEVHGLRIEPGTDGYKVTLRKESEDRRARHADRDRLKEEYQSRLDSFLHGRVYEDEINLARIYTKLGSFSSIQATKELMGRLSGHIRSGGRSSYVIETASSEIQNAWKVRDSLIIDQRVLLGRYEDEKNEAHKAGFRSQIVRNNRRIRLASQHADHYRDFLDFITGQAKGIKKGTVRFLKAANQGEFLSAVRLKRSGEDVKQDVKEQAPEEVRQDIKEQAYEEIKQEPVQQGPVQQEPVQQRPEQRMNAGAGIPLPEYHVSADTATEYEQQDTNNCWACAGAAIFNKFALLQDGELKDKIDQFDVRGFEPKADELKTPDQIRATGIQVSDELYKEYKGRMLDYMGAGRTAHGNIFEVADFFMKKRKDFALNRMLFHLPGLEAGADQPPKTDEDKLRDETKHHNQKTAFVNKLNEILGTGNLAAFYFETKKHYVTITKLDGDMVTYMDSSGNEERSMSVDKMLERRSGGVDVELTWFSKLPDHDELLKEYPLLYDEETGEYSPHEHSMEEALNLAHKEGVLVGKNDQQIGPYMEGISIATYIPRRRDGIGIQAPGQEQEPLLQQEQRPLEKEQQPPEQEEQQPLKQEQEERKAESWGFEDREKTIAMEKRQTGITMARNALIKERSERRPDEWKKHRNTSGSIEGRKAAGTAGCMTFLEGDDEEMSWQLYNGLTLRRGGLTREEKALKTRALERVFEVFLKADVKKMEFGRYSDLLSDSFMEIQVLSYMAFEFPNTFFDDYRELMKDPEAGCALTEEQYKEARAKWDFFYTHSGAFAHFLDVAKCEGVTEKDIETSLQLSDEVLAEGMNSRIAKKRDLSSAIMNFKNSIVGAFGPGWDAGKAYEQFRKEAGLQDERHEEDAIKAIRDRVTREKEIPVDVNDRDLSEAELGIRKAKEERRLNDKKIRHEAKEDGWEIVDDKRLSAEEKKKLEQDREKAERLTYENNALGKKLSPEDFKRYGSTAKHKYMAEKDARRVEWKSEGYIAAIPSGHEGIMELRPSLPLRVMAGDKEVELRRTYNYVVRALHMALFDEKGGFRKDTQQILDAGESIFMDTDKDTFDVKRAEKAMKKFFLPEIRKSLRESYRAKGEKISDRKINAEADRIISDWLLLQTTSKAAFVSGGDFLFESRLREIYRASQGDERWVANAKEAGFTEKEIEEVREYKKQELKTAVETLKKIASFDPEGKEVPLIGACSGHASFIQTCMLNYNGKISALMYYDFLKGSVRTRVQEVLEFILSDFEGFIISTKQTENGKKTLREKEPMLRGYLDKLKKGEKLTKNEMSIYMDIVAGHASYHHHAAGKIFSETDDEGNTVTYTTESAAKNVWDTYALPFTMDNYIGEYRGENHSVMSSDMTREMSEDEYKKIDPDYSYTYHSLPRCRMDNEGFIGVNELEGDRLFAHTRIVQLNMRSNIT